MKTVSANDLINLMNQHNLRQVDVCQLLGVSMDTVAKWKAGKRNMPGNLYDLLQILLIIKKREF